MAVAVNPELRLVLAHVRSHVADEERVHGRAREPRGNAVERRQVMRDDDVIRFDVGGQDLLEGGVLLVHPRLEVLDQREVVHEALVRLRRRVGAKPHRAGDETLTGDHDGVVLGYHDLGQLLRQLRQVARHLAGRRLVVLVVPGHVQDVAILPRERLEHALEVLVVAGHRDVARQHENVDAGRIQLANELGTAVGVHLEVEVGHDLELHDSPPRSVVAHPAPRTRPRSFANAATPSTKSPLSASSMPSRRPRTAPAATAGAIFIAVQINHPATDSFLTATNQWVVWCLTRR